MTNRIEELRFPVSGSALDSFRRAANNTNEWSGIFGKILTAPSAVWGRNQPAPQIWALIRVDRIRNDYRLLFRFVNAATGDDLHLQGIVIEHGPSRVAVPMVHTSMASMVAAKGMYGVRGETRMHHGFAVSSLRGVFPQARNLVVKLEMPSGVTSPVIGVPEVTEPTSVSEFGQFRAASSSRFTEERDFPRRGTFSYDPRLDGPRRVFRS